LWGWASTERLWEKGPYHAKIETEIQTIEVSALKTRTICVNPLFCGNRRASPSSTFMPNIKLNSYLEVPERAA